MASRASCEAPWFIIELERAYALIRLKASDDGIKNGFDGLVVDVVLTVGLRPYDRRKLR